MGLLHNVPPVTSIVYTKATDLPPLKHASIKQINKSAQLMLYSSLKMLEFQSIEPQPKTHQVF